MSQRAGVGLGVASLIRENDLTPSSWGCQCQAHRRLNDSMAAGSPRRGVESRGDNMAAMKPRTGDGPLEVTKEGRGIVMRVPLEGGGRLVVEMTPEEASDLGDALKSVVS